MRGPLRVAFGVAWCMIMIVVALSARSGSPSPPGPAIEPTAAILDAFQRYDVVAMGEGAHGNEQAAAFRLSLVRSPRFPRVVNDIVVEFGNALYQGVADRYVRGDDVPYALLRQIWENTTQAHTVWDKPIYHDFLTAVRSRNSSLPAEQRIRVLLGDPPVDWTHVQQASDVNAWARQRDSYPASLMRREVIAKGRRALVVYGDGHLFRQNSLGDSILKQLESPPAVKVFTIATITDADLQSRQPAVGSWARPSLSILRGTLLGATEFSFFYPLRGDEWKMKMEEQFDALLYLGPPASITRSRRPDSLCADTQYVRMRVQRMSLFPVLKGELDRFKRECQIQ